MDFTADQCRETAALKLADAQRNIGRIKKRLEDDAAAWLLLATKLEVSPAKQSKTALVGGSLPRTADSSIR
jgi:hypothetical protein